MRKSGDIVVITKAEKPFFSIGDVATLTKGENGAWWADFTGHGNSSVFDDGLWYIGPNENFKLKGPT